MKVALDVLRARLAQAENRLIDEQSTWADAQIEHVHTVNRLQEEIAGIREALDLLAKAEAGRAVALKFQSPTKLTFGPDEGPESGQMWNPSL